MAKALVITEKPSVARDIAGALKGFEEGDGYFENPDYVVSWAVGHLLEFVEPEGIDPKYKRWVLEDLPIIPNPFVLKPKSGQSERLNTLKKLYRRADVDRVVNACDAGREGELIFREIYDYVNSFKTGPEPKPTYRLWLQSMTPDAIREGFASLTPGEKFDGLGASAQCRSEADWLIGINATRALTRRMKTRSETSAWSAGRVQTPTLALLVDRELENLTFRPTPFWRIKATFKAVDHTYEGTWFDEKFKDDPDNPRKDDWITDADVLERILKTIVNQSGEASETRKLQKESPRPLFDLTSLQREANRRFGYSARRTLQAAQRLYETHKVLTYPRTDSKCLPSDYRPHVSKVLDEFSGGGEYADPARYLKKNGLRHEGRIFDDSKVSDHFAIIPTTGKVPASLSGDDRRIFDMVVRRFLAAFYPPAVWTRVERTTVVEGHHFRTRARFLKEPGWYEVWGKESDEDKALPPLRNAAADALARGLAGEDVEDSATSGAAVKTTEAHSEDDETRPPARYSEARLLSLMEHAGRAVEDEEITEALRGKGLGTPATRAEIIENLVSKHYVRRAEKTLRATPKGILLIDLLRRINIARLASPRLTGELELHLAEVEGGGRTRDDFMREVIEYTEEIVDIAKTFQYEDLYAKDPAVGKSPTNPQLKVVEQSRFYCSEDGATGKNGRASFIIWKEKNGRYLDRVTVEELLRNGETPLLDGFLTSRGQSYKARLKLSEQGELVLVSENGTTAVTPGQPAEIPENAQPIADCPFNPENKIYETETAYQCRCDGSCREAHKKLKYAAILPKVVCQREISVDEAVAFFTERKTPQWEDFVSRYGRNFTANLVLKENGKHGFEFAQRKGGGKRKKKGAEAETEGKAKTRAKGKKSDKTKAKTKRKSTARSKTKSKATSKAKSGK